MNPKITVVRAEPVPVVPPIESVTITLSSQDASDLFTLLGSLSVLDVKRVIAKNSTYSEQASDVGRRDAAYRLWNALSSALA